METLRPLSLDPSSLTTTATSFPDLHHHHHHHLLHLSPDSVLSRSFSVDSTTSASRLFPPRHPKSSPWRPASLNASPFFPRPSPSPRRPSHKLLSFWVPLYRKVKAMARRGGAPKEPAGAEPAPPWARRKSESFSRMDCCRPARVRAFDAGVERSIHDAVLHCKKSIGRED